MWYSWRGILFNSFSFGVRGTLNYTPNENRFYKLDLGNIQTHAIDALCRMAKECGECCCDHIFKDVWAIHPSLRLISMRWMCDAKEAACLGLSIIYCLDWLFRAFRIYATQLTIKINLFRPRIIIRVQILTILCVVFVHITYLTAISVSYWLHNTIPYCWWLMAVFAFSLQKHALNSYKCILTATRA